MFFVAWSDNFSAINYYYYRHEYSDAEGYLNTIAKCFPMMYEYYPKEEIKLLQIIKKNLMQKIINYIDKHI